MAYIMSIFAGLTDLAEEGHFVWGSDYGALTGYTNWGTGQPDDCEGNQDCVLSSTGYSFKWDDEFCQRTADAAGPIHAACQKPS